MSMNAPTLLSARESLISSEHEKLVLISHVQEQKRKIADLEREVQAQAKARELAERTVSELRLENESLRAQIPDDATLRAYGDLVQYLTTASAGKHLRVAA